MNESRLQLCEARERSGLSQSELARRAGVAQSVVSAYESGKRQSALQTLSRLIAATGHQMTISLERSDPGVRGLPNTPLDRRVQKHRQAPLDAVAEAGGSNLRVFGSVARGEDGNDSDVDLLIDLPHGTGLFALQALEGELRRILRMTSIWPQPAVSKADSAQGSKRKRSPYEPPGPRTPRRHP